MGIKLVGKAELTVESKKSQIMAIPIMVVVLVTKKESNMISDFSLLLY